MEILPLTKVAEHNIAEMVKDYFEHRKEVAFAYLFGSHAKGLASSLSDIDIAVYFYPKHYRSVEFEEPVYYEKEDTIWEEVERLLNKEIELLVLNRAPATVAASAIRGIPLVIKDWRLYLDFMEIITSLAVDFRDLLIKDFVNRTR
jgi:predicted nucleotidyltransferase